MLRDLFAAGPLPDLTVAYFADNDYRSHEVGPVAALPVVERIDRMLQEAFDAAGGLERVLEDVCVIITSDHGHCDVLGEAQDAVIRLDRLLGGYRQAALGRPWRTDDEIVICPNMRAAQIYLQTIRPELIEDIARAALMDPRLDQVMWRTVDTRPGADGYTVVTSRGRLEFAARPPGPNTVADAFGGHWSWSGDADAVDLQTDGGEIGFRLYPNAFERIAGILDSEQSGSIWMTARPGCEFEAPGGKPHVGGASHGALHALDSLSPLLIAGGQARPNLPGALRSIDIAPLCMQLLGLPMRYVPGAPRSAGRRGHRTG